LRARSRACHAQREPRDKRNQQAIAPAAHGIAALNDPWTKELTSVAKARVLATLRRGSMRVSRRATQRSEEAASLFHSSVTAPRRQQAAWLGEEGLMAKRASRCSCKPQLRRIPANFPLASSPHRS
jgi:hypothetical protein